MKPYIIVPVDWIEREIALYGERIVEYGDGEYYMAKIMLLYKLLDEFAILNKHHETRRESDSVELRAIPVTTRQPRHRSTRVKGEQTS